MDKRIVFYFLGRICAGMSLALLVPLLLALAYGEGCWRELGLAALTALAAGVALSWCGRGAARRELSLRESIGTVFLSWLLAAVLAALPFVYLGVLDPAAAMFESMSGLTTTGATAFSDLEVLPKSLLFWRSLTHWIGGIGIIVLFVALLPQVSGNAVYLFNAEVSGFGGDRILPRIRATAAALFYIYLLLTVILTGALVMLGLDAYDAVNHAFSTIATGGFSTYNASAAAFGSPAVEYVLGFFMLVSGGNFALYYQMTQSGIRVLWRDVEYRTYVLLLAALTLLIAADLICVNGLTAADSLRCAFFQVTSFGSTTGYVSCDYDTWPSFSKLLLAVTYLTGGCAGSTAGGIKICRFIVLVKAVAAEMRRLLHPQMLLNVYYGGQRLPLRLVSSISNFFFIYIAVIAVFAVVLAALGLTMEEALFGVASCISSVGPAFGSLGATGNYAQVPAAGKLVLALAMLLGRLELFTVLVLLRGEYWQKRSRW